MDDPGTQREGLVTEERQQQQQQQEEPEAQEMRGPGELIVGLDIGSTKICAVVGEVFQEHVEVLGMGSAASTGMRRGVLVSIENTVEGIRSAVAQAGEMAGCEVGSVYVGISAVHVSGFSSPGILTINNREIRQKDVQAVIREAQSVKISDNQQIIHSEPQEFMVDHQAGILNPLGMSGVRLATNVHIVTADVTALRNLTTCCNRAGLQVAEVVLESVASSRVLLDREEKERGVALVDIGGASTELAVFSGGAIKHVWHYGYGGNSMTSDLAQGLSTPMHEAERLKLMYGGAIASMIKDNFVIDVPSAGDRKPRKLSQRVLVDILEARLTEILQEVNKELISSGFHKRISTGLVLTGGSSLVPHIADLAEHIIGVPVRLGSPRGLAGRVEIVESPRCSTAVGLVLHGSRQLAGAALASQGGMGRLKRWWKELW